MNDGKQLVNILTGDWKKDLKTLPEELKQILREWSDIQTQIQRLKFGLIDIAEFEGRLNEIVSKR